MTKQDINVIFHTCTKMLCGADGSMRSLNQTYFRIRDNEANVPLK